MADASIRRLPTRTGMLHLRKKQFLHHAIHRPTKTALKFDTLAPFLSHAPSRPPPVARLTMSGVGLPTARSIACWKEITARRPPGPRQSSASGRAAASRPRSSFTAMHNAWKVPVAGWMPRDPPRRPFLLLLPRSCVWPMARTSCCVIRMKAPSRAATDPAAQHSTAARAGCTSWTRAQYRYISDMLFTHHEHTVAATRIAAQHTTKGSVPLHLMLTARAPLYSSPHHPLPISPTSLPLP